MTRFSSLISVFVSLIGFTACGTSEVVSVESDAGTIALDSDGRAPTGDMAGKDYDYQAGKDEVAQDTPSTSSGDIVEENTDTVEIDAPSPESSLAEGEEVVGETTEDTTDSEPDFHQDSKDIETNVETTEADVVVIVPPDIQPDTDTDTAEIDALSPESSDEVDEDVADVAGDTPSTSSGDIVKEAEAEPVCVPDCAGKECGLDGCGDSCGVCDDGNQCTDDVCQNGLCINTPLADWTPCELDGLTCSVDNCWGGECKNINLSTGFDEGEVPTTWSYQSYKGSWSSVSQLMGATTLPYAFVANGSNSGWGILKLDVFTLTNGHQTKLAFDYKSDFDPTIDLGSLFVVSLSCPYNDTTTYANLLIIDNGVESWSHYEIDLSPYLGFCYIEFSFSFPPALPHFQVVDTIQFGCL